MRREPALEVARARPAFGFFPIEQSFHGGTGPFANAHGSIRIVDLDLSVYTGQLGF